jgi:hypothetical protein
MNVFNMADPGMMFIQHVVCTGFIEDPEAGPKWCHQCGLRRYLHTDVSSSFEESVSRETGRDHG